MSSRYPWRYSRDRDRWLADLERWGYPENNWTNYVLIEIGDSSGWMWFEFVGPGVALMHMAVSPDIQGIGAAWWGRHGHLKLRHALEFLGVQRVYYVDNGYNEKIGEYVKRLGWHEFDQGYYLEV